MKPEKEERREESHETSTGSFYEPRTIPKKWDVSAFVSHATTAGKGNAEQPAEQLNQPESELPDEESATRNPEPFPQPRTVPGKWDVSELK